MFLNPEIILPKGLSARLGVLLMLTFMALLCIAGTGLYFTMGSLADHQLEQDLDEELEDFRALYRTHGLRALKTEIDREGLSVGTQPDEFIQLFDRSGRLVHGSHGWSLNSLSATGLQALESRSLPMLEYVEIDSAEYPFITRLGEIDGGLYLYSGESLEERELILERVLQAFAIALIFVAPLSMAVAWLVAGRSARGIESISAALSRVEQGDLDTQVHLETSVEELSHLARAFNGMVERIRSLIIEMREMTDNIAHDLRSPLGRIRAISENALICAQKPSEYIRAAEDTLVECDRLLRLINATLDVAELEAGVYQGELGSIDLSQVVTEAYELFEPVAGQNKQQLRLGNLEHCHIQGNLHNLQRMVANLIDNAIKYTPQGGSIDVNMIRDPSGCRIIVLDTGIGISAQNQPHIFERFYRCNESRSSDGCGLGLSFSRAVAKQHGGDIRLERSKPYTETVFTILLPCA